MAPSPIATHSSSQWSLVQILLPLPPRSSSADERASNIVLFGLPEGKSLVESKKVVDEILEFVAGKSVKYVRSTSSLSRSRPILIKFCTAWDRKLVLLRKTAL